MRVDRSGWTRHGLLASGLCAVLVQACGGAAPVETRGAPVGGKADSLQASSSMYLRGTCNAWGKTAMQLVGDTLWEVTVAFGSSPAERFKFDQRGDWTVNYGDSDRDGLTERNGKDIPVTAGRTYVISFDEASGAYSVAEKSYGGEVTYGLPVGLAAGDLQGKQALLFREGQTVGWNYLYVETQGGSSWVHTPLAGLTPGSYQLVFDQVIGAQRYAGEVSFLVGAADIQVTLLLAPASLSDHGTVRLQVLSDSFQGGKLVGAPLAQMGVFRGDWQAGNLLGHTDAAGTFEALLPAGQLTLSVFKMTSSHSVASQSGIALGVVAGQTTTREVRLAPYVVNVQAKHDPGHGQALYLTGATSYLGSWKSAIKMSWNPAISGWSLSRALPVGLPFKVVRAPWTAAGTLAIDSAGVHWEQGSNRSVPAPSGSYDITVSFSPAF